MADLTILGLTELHRALQDLPAKIERNVLRGGLRAGAKTIENEARRLVPARSGKLRDSVRVVTRTSSRTGMVRAQIKAGGRGKNAAYYAHWVEFGTSRHWIKPKNRKSLFFAGLMREAVEHPGAQRRPFLRPAFDAKAQTSIEEMARYIRERLPKEIAKQGRMP
jgi:HK97 gp10 family phage protein